MLPELPPVELIREHRKRLELLQAQLADRGASLSPAEAQVLVASTALCLDFLEWQLTRPAPQRRGLYHLGRIRALTRPRLGRLTHYPPKPLMVPASYLRAEAPHPPPTISIVTPSFEHARFVERTMCSVLDQRYPELEYFVQDGGSTDGTLEILERHRAELTGCASERDAGQGQAINRAFDRTSGEIMSWLNSDDLLLPGSLAYVAGYFAAHPEVDVVYGNRIMIDENDGQIGAWILPKHDDFALTLADFVPQESLFWRRRIWEGAGGRVDESFGYALDWDLLLRFQSAGARMVRLPRFLGAFRVHDVQKTSAAHTIGQVEMARLRQRVHGRPVPLAEVDKRLRPYLRRHVVHHLRQRVVDRLPLDRVTVQTPRQQLPAGTDEKPELPPSTPADAEPASVGARPHS